MNEITIGIDLGTTNTLAGYIKRGKPQLFKFSGKPTLPSVIYVEEDDSITVGRTAKKKFISDERNGVRSAKTSMGNPQQKWVCRGRTFTPTEVAAQVLKEVKRTVLKKMKLEEADTTVNAVITIPAYFNSNQSDETKKAGQQAGLNVMRIITEPMAAAVYAIKELDCDKKILVFDLGGGTFDLSILSADADSNRYEAICVGGDRKLGGDDFDACLLEYFIETIRQDIGVDLSSRQRCGMGEYEYFSVKNILLEEAEQAKMELSQQDETDVDIPNLFAYKGKSYDFSTIITRADFDECCQPLYQRIFDSLDSFLAEAKGKKQVSLEDIGYIVLAGGSCAIPYICQEIERRFPQVEVNEELDKELLVVNGACMIADNEAQGINIINDIISHSLGVEEYSDGIAKLSKIIPAGEHYPCDKTEVYTTTQDYQEVVEINIYEAGQGKEDVAEIQEGIHDFYGSMVLSGIQRAKAGEPEIEVTFSYDKSRCLTVTARDKKTHATKQVVIEKGQAARQPARQQKPMDIVVLLDSSRSMYARSAMNEAIKACRYLINSLIDLSVHRLGLADFNNVTTVRCPLSQDKGSLLGNLDYIKPTGGTDVCPALNCAMGMFEDKGSQRVIIIVTDGGAGDNPYSKIKRMLKSGIRIIAIGVGSGINEKKLKRMAGEGDAYHLDDMSQLQDAFETVVNKIMKA